MTIKKRKIIAMIKTGTGIVKRKFDRDQDWTKKCDFADPYPKYC
jgi:hypothetical protein